MHEDGTITDFTALDRFSPDKQHLQVINIRDKTGRGPKSHKLRFDPAWISILRATNHFINVEAYRDHLPPHWNFQPNRRSVEEVESILGGNLDIPENFEATERAFDPLTQSLEDLKVTTSPAWKPNPQTQWFCATFGLHDPIELIQSRLRQRQLTVAPPRPKPASPVVPATADTDGQESAPGPEKFSAESKDWRAGPRPARDEPRSEGLERPQRPSRNEPRPEGFKPRQRPPSIAPRFGGFERRQRPPRSEPRPCGEEEHRPRGPKPDSDADSLAPASDVHSPAPESDVKTEGDGDGAVGPL